MYKIHGIGLSEFQNDFKNILKLIHPEDQSKVQAVFTQLLSGESSQIEYRIFQKDGTEKYVLGKGDPLFDKDGQVVAIFGYLQDITENKMLEQELRKNYRIIAQAQSLAKIG
ncbi:MAG TPA: PAS domain-containing protein, partial [Clostridia bacterium]|nr:PAS domain-containing protein [Clostridia bacterium]